MKLPYLRRKPDKTLDSIKLAPNEWDFRRLRDSELHLCIRYEYARAALWFRELVESWLNSPFPDWTYGERIVNRLARPRDSQRAIIFLDRKVTVRDALRKNSRRECRREVLAELIDKIPRQIIEADAVS